ncbi:MAG: hypothetical protein WC505_03760 [Patescibacteria group bacterium]
MDQQSDNTHKNGPWPILITILFVIIVAVGMAYVILTTDSNENSTTNAANAPLNGNTAPTNT